MFYGLLCTYMLRKLLKGINIPALAFLMHEKISFKMISDSKMSSISYTMFHTSQKGSPVRS